MNTSSPTVAQDNGGIFASTVNSVRNTASFVGSAINNGLVQPVNTLLNLPNQAADAIAGHFGWSDFDTADERFAAAQSTPIPGDDLVFGALGAVSRAARAERTITVSRSRFPQSAAHIEDAISSGKPNILTINRTRASTNRRESLRGIRTQHGLDRDEFPPAMFQEGGNGASVRHINPRDNRGAGACIGAQCRDLSDGTRIKIEVVE